VPLVPVAINGTTWVPFGARLRVRVGEPITTEGRADRATIAATTEALRAAMLGLIADAPAVPEPGRVGRWMTERFNDWPEGSREATLAAESALADPVSGGDAPGGDATRG
jgi:hypothetical protein